MFERMFREGRDYRWQHGRHRHGRPPRRRRVDLRLHGDRGRAAQRGTPRPLLRHEHLRSRATAASAPTASTPIRAWRSCSWASRPRASPRFCRAACPRPEGYPRGAPSSASSTSRPSAPAAQRPRPSRRRSSWRRPASAGAITATGSPSTTRAAASRDRPPRSSWLTWPRAPRASASARAASCSATTAR